MTDRFDRTRKLVGEKALERLQNSHVLVVGLGGVGSYALESLIRSGIGTLTIADFDTVDISNLNRQLETLQENIGRKKTAVFLERAFQINPDVRIRVRDLFVNNDTAGSLFDVQYDYAVDCIDSSEGKLAIWKICQQRNIPFVSSLGMANRLDPQQVQLTKLNKTTGDPLARKLRYEAKKEGIDLNIDVVFSSETPLRTSETKGDLGSMMFVPAAAGLTCGYCVIRNLIEDKENG
ncbi:MAG: tRNA threonylcarbamoyladenosine dehydratase [Erysipelotrichaceae bacterium]|nr:tRNA threonylcarbamoyladenosine dehydratase [Erysipelotrichaceae bacterium]